MSKFLFPKVVRPNFCNYEFSLPFYLSKLTRISLILIIFCGASSVEASEETYLVNFAQQLTVSGTVTDSNGLPLPGVTVQEQDTSNGVVTDFDGNFTIEVRSPQSVLVFTFVGMERVERIVGDNTTMEVQLGADAEALEEVVVTALGIKRESRSLTYAAQNLDGDDISEAKDVNMINNLQGKVAGVTITRNATGPGGDSKVLIRGSRSITNDNQPLFVIDGVPLYGNVGMINADEVESMNVLKGATAAALYGSQGQNGAIIITTKRGNPGGTTINYVSGITFDQAAVLPELQYEYGQGDEGVFGPSSENSWGPRAMGQMVTLWNGNSVPLEGQPDVLEDFFRTAVTLNNTLSISGGNDKMLTYFSYGNTTAQGIVRGNDLNRHNINLKTDNFVSSKFSISTSLSYIYEDIDNQLSPSGGGSRALPSIYSSPTSIPAEEMQNYFYIDESGMERQNYWKPGSSVLSNPYWALNRVLDFQRRDRLIGLISAKYIFADWVNFQVRGSLDKTIRKNDTKIFADNYFSQVGSNYNYSEGINQGVNVDALLSFDLGFGEPWHFSGNLGAAFQENKYEGMSGSAGGLNEPNFFFLNNARSPSIQSSYGRSPQVQSVYGTAALDYERKIYLEATARNDWSSALPENSQSYFYPSLGLSAIVSEMLELPSWVSYGKARLTYASSGYGGTEYLDRNYFSVGPGGAIITPSIQSLGDYKPEMTISYEAGLDWRFFNNRFGINLTYYNSQTKNQLLLIGLPAATLFDEKYINAGLIQNEGIELIANFTPIRLGDFEWDSTVNFSKNNNKVKELTENVKSIVLNEGDNVYLIKVEEGRSYGDMYVRGWKEDEQGRKLVAEDGTPILTEGLDEFVGNYNPEFMLGFSNSLTFKNFSLSFLIDHREGGTVFAGTQALIDAYGHSKQSLRGREGGIILDAYTVEGERNTQSISSQKYFGLIGGRYPSAGFYSYSSTNTRLRELTLGYRFSDGFLSRASFIKDAKLTLIGRNLFFFYRPAPVDPEVTRGVQGGGLEYAAIPSTRTFGLNLNLTF